MHIEIHQLDGSKVAQVTAEDILINHAEDGLQLLADLYYQDTDKIILHEKNITSDFFDLKTGLAGELLQKFSNYKVRLAIVGAFDNYPSKSLKDFIFESNKGRQVNFVASVEEALERLSR